MSGYTASTVTRRQPSGRETVGNQGTSRKGKEREGKEKRRALRGSACIRYFSPKLAKSGPATKRRDSSFSSACVCKRNDEVNGDGGSEHRSAGAQTDGRYTYIPEGSIRARVLTDRAKLQRFRDVD